MSLPLVLLAWVRSGRPRPGFGRTATDGDAPRRTTHQRNAQNTTTQDVQYPWHPWSGKRVIVVEGVKRSDRSVARCCLEDDENGRALELPHWMLDRAACCSMRASEVPVVRCADLRHLRDLLRQVTGAAERKVVENWCPSSSLEGATDASSIRSPITDSVGAIPTLPADTAMGGTPGRRTLQDTVAAGTTPEHLPPSPRRGQSRPGGGR